MSLPRIKLFKAVDDESYAAAFVDSSGKLLPVFQLSTAKSAEACMQEAERWLHDMAARRDKPKRPAKPESEEDIFG